VGRWHSAPEAFDVIDSTVSPDQRKTLAEVRFPPLQPLFFNSSGTLTICLRLSLCVPMCLCAYVPVCLCACVPVCLCAYVPVCLCACVPVRGPIDLQDAAADRDWQAIRR
jgi:hypothetical protein